VVRIDSDVLCFQRLYTPGLFFAYPLVPVSVRRELIVQQVHLSTSSGHAIIVDAWSTARFSNPKLFRLYGVFHSSAISAASLSRIQTSEDTTEQSMS